jgi:phospholipase C
MLRRTVRLLPALLLLPVTLFGSPIVAQGGLPTPIRHVVIIDQENHSFDNLLGLLCLQLGRCAGPMTINGTPIGLGQDPLTHATITIPLQPATDIVAASPHSHDAQVTAVDNGKMDGFNLMVENDQDCSQASGYTCYQAYQPDQIPNLATLVKNFVIADHTFQSDVAASWGAHLGLVAGTMDGFYGNNPCQNLPGLPRDCTTATLGPGWGCDSNRDALWTSPGAPAGTQPTFEPTCIPDSALPLANGGAYRPTPVQWVPTLMDRLDAARLSWRLYAGSGVATNSTGFQSGGYQWATCPSFADCLYTRQAKNMVNMTQVLDDAKGGTLPAVSIVTPTLGKSQHNFYSMKLGDNWIGQVVKAIEAGSDWSSTAIFITYDDCGCFYDHVAPPSVQLGIRVPMVIVSPYARRAFTDSNVASYASLLAFNEYVFGLQPLATADAKAYNFLGSFDFTQPGLAPVQMVTSSVSADELGYIRAHPGPDNDPT